MSGIKSISWRGEKISLLALGTVQLGMDYGIANSHGKPSEVQARELVHQAWASGINVFDTAQAYGESETVLGKVLNSMGISDSAKVISKLSPSLSPKDLPAISASIEESMRKLGVRQLWGLMLHRSEWLDNWNDGLGEILEKMRRNGEINYLGVSVYSPQEAKKALNTIGIDMLQTPCNAWDQRMIESGVFADAKSKDKLCFVRSIYLQGLMLMSPDKVMEKLPSAYQASLKWSSFAETKGLSKAELAAKFAKSLDLPVVVGMESSKQLEENVELFSAEALDPKTIAELRENLIPLINDELINPAKWNPTK
ncbi:MAG TPA: aldo/keto reductase [Victivallales bacterium]|nr:aldo/keto reductase [Victivallales bacterium]